MHLTELVRLALAEDIGPGDLTTETCVPAANRAEAVVRAKAPLVVCGHLEATEVFRQMQVNYEPLVDEGIEVTSGTLVARLEGPARGVLSGERVALNFLMHLSGIATHVRRMVASAAGLRVVDTRKTIPLMRAPERRAVRIGGGANHRFALYDGILIKDNHIVAAGGISPAVAAARARAHHLLRIEVEVESLEEAREALAAGADVIMLDNMDNARIQEVLAELGGRAQFEVSGNVGRERLAHLATLGVDLVSMGGLIHQAPWVDLSMKLTRVSTGSGW